MVVAKIGKYIRKIDPDNIFQKNDMCFFFVSWQYDKTAKCFGWNLDQRILLFVCRVFFLHHHSKINALVPQIRQFSQTLNHQWDDIRANFFFEKINNKPFLISG